MRGFFSILLVAVLGFCSSKFVSKEPETFHERLEKVYDILDEVPLIDGRNNLASGIHYGLNDQIYFFQFDQNLTELEPRTSYTSSHTDIPSLIDGMVGAQFWNTWVPCDVSNSEYVSIIIEEIDAIRRLIERYPKDLQFAGSTDDILSTFDNSEKIASLIGVTGGHAIRNSLAVLRAYYYLGVRYLTLTHNCNTDWAESAFSSDDKYPTVAHVKGLTDFGKLVILEMNRLGMLVDLSFSSDETVNDVLAVTVDPVIFSHSNARALCKDQRNVPDDLLKKLKNNGGIVMVNFYPPFLTCSDNATIYDVIDHINHIRNIAGIDHVGIGSAFNGINKVPEGLENVSKFPNLFAELMLDPTWTKEDLKKLAGDNFLRVFRHVESVKHDLGAEYPIEIKMAIDEKK